VAEWDVTVEWTVEADTPHEAAEMAWENIRRSTGPIMTVSPHGTLTGSVDVDLSNDDDLNPDLDAGTS
jgi:hypothetical protein